MSTVSVVMIVRAPASGDTYQDLMAQSLAPTELQVVQVGSGHPGVPDGVPWQRVVPPSRLTSLLNELLRECRTDYLAVVEDGVRLDPTWLQSLAARLDAGASAVRARTVWEGATYLAGRWVGFFGTGLTGERLEHGPVVQGAQALYSVADLRAARGFRTTTDRSFDPGPWLQAAGKRVECVEDEVARQLAPQTLKAAADLFWHHTSPSRWKLADVPPQEREARVLKRLIERYLDTLAHALRDAMDARRFHLLMPSYTILTRNLVRDVARHPGLAAEARRQLPLATLAAATAFIRTEGPETAALSSYFIEQMEDLLGSRDTVATLSHWGEWVETPAALHPVASPLDRFHGHLKALADEAIELFKGATKASRVGVRMWASAVERDRTEQRERGLNTEQPFRVLVVNPPWVTDTGRLGVRAGSRWPFTMQKDRAGADIPHYCPFPFFLAYTTAYLKQNGVATVLVDCIAEGLSDEEFVALATGYKPSLVLMETSTASIDLDLAYAKCLKEAIPGVQICLGGSHASICGGDLLKNAPFVDFTLNGEMEVGTLQLTRALTGAGVAFKDIKGLNYRDGAEIRSQGKAEAPEFSQLPWPERITMPMYNYDDRPVSAMQWPCVQLTATRGCPYTCTFCLWPQVIFNGTSVRYRTRDPEDVAREIRWSVDMFGFKSFYLDDDTFNIGKRRMLNLASALKGQSLQHLHWMGMARSDHSDRETLSALKDAGMIAIKYGVEHGVQSMVNHISKELDLATVKTAVDDCKALGIQVHLTYSMGLPGETPETIRLNFEHAASLAPDSIQLSIMTPFPGTKLYNEVSEKGQLKAHSWKDFDGMASTVTITEHMSKEMLEEKHKLFQSLWYHFRNHQSQSMVEMLAMFGGASMQEAADALRGSRDSLPLAGPTVVEALVNEWPEQITETLGAVLTADHVAVLEEPAGGLAVAIGRRPGKQVDYVDADAGRRDFVRFRALAERSVVNVREKLDPMGYPTIVVSGLVEVARLRQLRAHLHFNGILLQVFQAFDGARRHACAALEAAGFGVADIVEEQGYLVAIGLHAHVAAHRDGYSAHS